ncbi:MAG: membrane protein insertion efficiency factor YidD [Puniceicoccales bacterium]|nr:membrane protein insertion efficiency factor YidD [Puniceicoccales bacterium]
MEKFVVSLLANGNCSAKDPCMMACWRRCIRELFIFPLHIYLLLSPLKIYLLGTACSCRFYPTCSHYACECIEKYGILRSIPLILWRICRCHPWSIGGHDPVP